MLQDELASVGTGSDGQIETLSPTRKTDAVEITQLNNRQATHIAEQNKSTVDSMDKNIEVGLVNRIELDDFEESAGILGATALLATYRVTKQCDRMFNRAEFEQIQKELSVAFT